jgi:hypothetical protein
LITMTDGTAKLTCDDLSVLTHSQLSYAYSAATGHALTVDSGLSRAAVLTRCEGHFSASDLNLLRTPKGKSYPKAWDSLQAVNGPVTNRSFSLPRAADPKVVPSDPSVVLEQSFSTDADLAMETTLRNIATAEAKAVASMNSGDGKAGTPDSNNSVKELLQHITNAIQKLSQDHISLRSQTQDLIPKVKLKPSETWKPSQTLRPPTVQDTSSAIWSQSVVPHAKSSGKDLVALPIGPLRAVGEVLTDPKQKWRRRLTAYAKRTPPLPAGMAAHRPQPTVFQAEVKEALMKLPGLTLVAEMVPEVQKRELQLWNSVVWVHSEFDRMVAAGTPASQNEESGKLELFKEGTAPESLSQHSHVIVSSADLEVLHELLFVAEQLALAAPARLANKIRSRLCSQWNIPQFQKSEEGEHSLFSAKDMKKAAEAVKLRDSFASVTAKRKRW